MPADPRPRPHDDAPPVPPIGEDDTGDDGAETGELPAGFDDETVEDLLDDRTGEGDEIENLEDPAGSEDGWTLDSDPEDEEGDDDDGPSDAEDGWTDDTEAAGGDDWEDDLLPESQPAVDPEDDTGEEGLDDELADPSELEPTPLGAPDDDDDETEGQETLDDEADEGPEWRLPDRADPATVLVHHLGPMDQGVVALALAGDDLWAAGGDLFVRREGTPMSRVEDPALEGTEIQTVALVPDADVTAVVVGTVVGGCLVRRDPGAAFEPANGWTSGRPGAFAIAGHGTALLGRTSDGALFRSDDAARTWRQLDPGGRAVGAALDGERLWALLALPDGAALARSDDGGRSFVRLGLPVAVLPHAGAEVGLAVSGDRVIVAGEEIGVLASVDGGHTFERWPCPVTLAAALDPFDAETAYVSLFHAAEDQGAIAMTRDGGKTFVTLAEMSQLRRVFRIDEQGDPDGDNRVHAIGVDPLVRGRVYLASAAGAFVLAVRS